MTDAPGGGGPGPDAAAHPECELCEAVPMTPWHYHDEVCWVADCEVCDTPMVVWWRHGPEPPSAHADHMLAVLGRVADERLGVGAWRIDAVMRQVPQHFHAHARHRDPWRRWRS